MTPVDVFFGIQALVRLGRAGQQALEQAIRDRDIVLPLPVYQQPSAVEFAGRVLLDGVNMDQLLPGGELADLAFPPQAPSIIPKLKTDLASQLKQVEAANEIVTKALRDAQLGTSAQAAQLVGESGGLYVVRQWVKGDDKPPPPLARIGLALAEIALEYAAAKPSLFGAGASGEKLIAAIALNLEELLPDPDDPADWKTSFAEQATAIVFRATLKTLSEQADLLIDKKPLADLAKGLIKPIVELASQTPGQLPQWNALRDTLLGPVAAAGAKAVMDNQAGWLGGGFDTEKAVAAITKVLLTEAASGGLRGLVSDDGAARVYQGVLATIGANPALIAGVGGGPEGDLVRDLLTRATDVLRHAPQPFKGVTGAALLDQAVAAFGAYLPNRIGGDGPWSTLAVNALQSVLQGAADAANGGAPLLAPARIEGFAKLLFAQAAATPQMVTGAGNSELTRIAGALFATLASDKASLLSDETWLDVASTALREAALNPGALVGVGNAGPLHALGFEYLSSLLNVAADQIAAHGRTQGNLLFGETLASAAKATLAAAAANAARLGEAAVKDAYENLLRRLTQFAMAQAGAVGAEGWLELFCQLVGPVLRDGDLPVLSDDQLLELLHKEAA
jgi:hypothetical protein